MIHPIKKLISFVLTLCLLGGACGGLAACTSQAPQADAPSFGGGMVLSSDAPDETPSDDSPAISLAYMAMAASSSDAVTTPQVVTATVTPSGNYTVTWTVEWANASSAWATGKTASDYVAFGKTKGEAKATASGNAANIQLMQPFGEQIHIRATLRDYPSVTGTLNVDYLQGARVIIQSTSQALLMQQDEENPSQGYIINLFPGATTMNDFITKEREFLVILRLDQAYTIKADYSAFTVRFAANPMLWNQPLETVVSVCKDYAYLMGMDAEILKGSVDQIVSETSSGVVWKITDQTHLNNWTCAFFGLTYQTWSRLCTVSDTAPNFTQNLGQFRQALQDAWGNYPDWIFSFTYSLNGKNQTVYIAYGDVGGATFKDEYFASAPYWAG